MAMSPMRKIKNHRWSALLTSIFIHAAALATLGTYQLTQRPQNKGSETFVEINSAESASAPATPAAPSEAKSSEPTAAPAPSLPSAPSLPPAHTEVSAPPVAPVAVHVAVKHKKISATLPEKKSEPQVEKSQAPEPDQAVASESVEVVKEEEPPSEVVPPAQAKEPPPVVVAPTAESSSQPAVQEASSSTEETVAPAPMESSSAQKVGASDGQTAGLPAGVVNGDQLKVLKQARPSYPISDNLRRFEGETTLLYKVMPNGSVENIRVHKTSGSKAMDESAIQALRQFVYNPGQDVEALKTFQFRLKGEVRTLPARLGGHQAK